MEKKQYTEDYQAEEPMKNQDILSNLFGSFEVVSDEAYEQKEAELKRQEEEARIAHLESNFRTSGVGSKYFKLTLNDYRTDDESKTGNLATVKQAIEDINHGKARTLWLCGKNGNGKTFLGAMIVKYCGGAFRRAYDIEDDLKDAERFGSEESRKEVFMRYKSYPVLVIDEVGRFQSENELKFLFHILNDRYEADRSTILCSNLTTQDMKKYLGNALVDRFVENCTTLSFNASSYRVEKRIEENKGKEE